ncbi:unnamed protein product [Caenorhabditis angaria]|uniref:Uncharacterized protein n=1 Tax=Caenorhabditis angaria TaxID=860376 RepID=A0A9P1IMB4_9PELO|nr:unnamed protein product [Caenorhabditis angaria]
MGNFSKIILSIIFLLSIKELLGKSPKDVHKNEQRLKMSKILKPRLGQAYQRCYSFVTPMELIKMETPPFYWMSKKMLKLMNSERNFEVFCDYVTETMVKKRSVDYFGNSWKGLKHVPNLIIYNVTNSVLMIMSILTIRFVPGTFELVGNTLKIIRKFRWSTIIPVYLCYLLFCLSFEFMFAAQIAEDRLKLGDEWHELFFKSHTTWVDTKIDQFHCIVDEYWKVMNIFRTWLNPYEEYRAILNSTSGIFFKNMSLGEFMKIKNMPERQLDVITQKVVDILHKYMLKPPNPALARTNDLKGLVSTYYNKTLQLPLQEDVLFLKLAIPLMSMITIIIGISVSILAIYRNFAWHSKLLNVFEKLQFIILFIIFAKTFIFVVGLAQVSGTYAVQRTLSGGNFTFLKNAKTKHGISIGELFSDSYSTNRTIYQLMGRNCYGFDSRPERFNPQILLTNFTFLNAILGPKANENFNTKPIFRHFAHHFGFQLQESPRFFNAIFFSLNFSRFTNAIMKHVIVPVSTPVWLLAMMPVLHYMIALYVMFAIPKIKRKNSSSASEEFILEGD